MGRLDKRSLRVLHGDLLGDALFHHAGGVQLIDQIASLDDFALFHQKEDSGLTFDLALDVDAVRRLEVAAFDDRDVEHAAAHFGSHGSHAFLATAEVAKAA